MPELIGYRGQHAAFCASVWQGELLLSGGSSSPIAPAVPRPDERNGWCRVLTAPGIGMAVLNDINYVHRSARLSIATRAAVDAPEAAEVLVAAVRIARDRLHLHRVYGVLPQSASAAAATAAAQGFRLELTVAHHLWLDDEPQSACFWGRCFGVE
jgi:hypothetical protein